MDKKVVNNTKLTTQKTKVNILEKNPDLTT